MHFLLSFFFPEIYYLPWSFQAFKKAWEVACSSNGAVLVVVPQKNYRLKPIRFSGPCKSDITMQVIKLVKKVSYFSKLQALYIYQINIIIIIIFF